MPWRYDKGEYLHAEKLPNGFLRADAILTRTGVFQYRNADGSVRRELRLPEEVFAQDSIRTLQLVPVTLEHPTVPVASENFRKLMMGTVGSDVRIDGENLAGTVMLHDSRAVKEVEDGIRREVSCGYWADLEKTPGEYKGERYDGIQRNIRYNHLAITAKGKAGNARIRLDSEAAEMFYVTDEGEGPKPKPEDRQMHKLTLDGVTFETENLQLVQAVQREMERKDSEIKKASDERDEAKSEVQKQTARADAAEKDLKDEKTKREDAEKPERVRELVDARLGLERSAEPLLREQLKKDKKEIAAFSDEEIKHAVIKLHDPDLDLTNKDSSYVDGRYDAALSSLAKKRDDSAAQSRRKVADAAANPSDAGGDDAEAKFKQDSQEAWKKPLHATNE